MAILVLGGAGYIGSHMVDRLIEKGDEEVVVVDNLVTGHRQAVHKKARFYEGDIADKDFMRKVFSENPEIDAIIHFFFLRSLISKELLFFICFSIFHISLNIFTYFSQICFFELFKYFTTLIAFYFRNISYYISLYCFLFLIYDSKRFKRV